MNRYPLFVCLLLGSIGLSAQAPADINGRVIDGKGETMVSATVQLFTGTEQQDGTVTDVNGIYRFDAIRPGIYRLVASMVGHAGDTIEVKVDPGELKILDLTLRADATLDEVRIIAYREELVDKGGDATAVKLSTTELKQHPARNLQKAIVDRTPRVYQRKENTRGGGIHISGARESSTAFYLDGIRMRGDFNMPMSAVKSVQVFVGGIPARYGDVTGGVIEISTIGYQDFLSEPVASSRSKKRKLPRPQGPPAED